MEGSDSGRTQTLIEMRKKLERSLYDCLSYQLREPSTITITTSNSSNQDGSETDLLNSINNSNISNIGISPSSTTSYPILVSQSLNSALVYSLSRSNTIENDLNSQSLLALSNEFIDEEEILQQLQSSTRRDQIDAMATLIKEFSNGKLFQYYLLFFLISYIFEIIVLYFIY